jgi:hypothetical protein
MLKDSLDDKCKMQELTIIQDNVIGDKIKNMRCIQYFCMILQKTLCKMN